jgi:hypothetical protein
MTNDTRNSLTQFDLCVAIAEKSLNSQLRTGWKQWLARSEFSSAPPIPGDFTGTIEIYPTNPDTGKPSRYGLKATLDPLTVSLNVPNGKLGQVQVTLTLVSGQIDFYSETKEAHLSQPIENWKVSFVADLDKQPVDWDTLKLIDPAAHYTAEQMVKNAELPPSVFSIEYLAMAFSKVDLVSNSVVDIPDGVPGDAVVKAKAMLNLLISGKTGDYVLGTVVRRSKTRGIALPSFALTDFIFDVKGDPVPCASTLSYLGMFSKNPLPDNIDTARIALQDNWLRPEMLDGTGGLVSGVMVISKHTLLDNYLIPLFTKVLGRGPELSANGLRWTYKNADKKSYRRKTIIWHNFDSGWDWQIDVEAVPGKAQLNISGRVNSFVHYEGRTLDCGFFGGDDRTEGLYNDGHQDVKATLALTGKGGCLDFRIYADIPETEYFTPVVIDRHQTFGMSHVTEAMGSAFEAIGIIGKTPGDMLASASASQLTAVRNGIRSALGAIDILCNEHVFVPPGGGEFTFQDFRFSDAGDAILDVIYQSP